MNIDCHYYGTYYIARQAGWDDYDAQKIAWAAQTVDMLDVGTLKDVYQNESEDEKKIAHLTTVLDPKSDMWHLMTYSYAYRYLIMFTWMPFHFLPDLPKNIKDRPDINKNAVYRLYKECLIKKIDEFIDGAKDLAIETGKTIWETIGKKIRELVKKGEDKEEIETQMIKIVCGESLEKLYNDDYKLICRTSTQLCENMIKDVKEKCSELVKTRECSDERDKALFRIGICMHVLADTWSHQNFCGNGDFFINTGNSFGGNFDRFTKGGIGINMIAKVVEKGSPFSSIWAGHGPVDSNPDIPARFYLYNPSYTEKFLYVVNGRRFLNAFYQMYVALSYIKNENETYDDFKKKFDERNAEKTFEKLDSHKPFDVDKTVYYTGKLNKVHDILNYMFITSNDKDCSVKWMELAKSCEDCNLKIYEKNSDDYRSLKKFMVPAKEHRDFIMEQTGYSSKIQTIDFIVSQLLEGKGITDIDVKEDGCSDYYVALNEYDAYEEFKSVYPSINPETMMASNNQPGISNQTSSAAERNGESKEIASNESSPTNIISSNGKNNGNGVAVASNGSRINPDKPVIGEIYCKGQIGGEWNA